MWRKFDKREFLFFTHCALWKNQKYQVKNKIRIKGAFPKLSCYYVKIIPKCPYFHVKPNLKKKNLANCKIYLTVIVSFTGVIRFRKEEAVRPLWSNGESAFETKSRSTWVLWTRSHSRFWKWYDCWRNIQYVLWWRWDISKLLEFYVKSIFSKLQDFLVNQCMLDVAGPQLIFNAIFITPIIIQKIQSERYVCKQSWPVKC